MRSIFARQVKRAITRTSQSTRGRGYSHTRDEMNPVTKACLLTTAGITGITATVLAYNSIYTVKPGCVAVTNLFGKVDKDVLPPGLHFVNPFLKIHQWTTQTRHLEYNLNVPSQEGLMIDVDVSLQYRLDPTHIPKLFSTVGFNYEDVLIKPLIMSTIRSVSSGFDAKAFYTSVAREEMSVLVLNKLTALLEPRGLIIESVPLRNVILPESLRKSIEDKLRADQESQRMEFILLKEKQEAERKGIEAKGIADFQTIVSQGITPSLLKWREIEAVTALAKSDNTKIVFFGNNDGKTPVILNHSK